MKNVGSIKKRREGDQTLRRSLGLITFVVMKLGNHSYSSDKWKW